MKMINFTFMILAFALISCNSKSKNKTDSGKSAVVSQRSNSVTDAFFDNFFYSEPLDKSEIEAREKDLIKICLIAWLIDSSEKVKPSRRLLKAHSSEIKVEEYLNQIKIATKKVIVNKETNVTYIQNEKGALLFMVPCVSQKMIQMFESDGDEGINEFVDFIFGL